MCASRKPVIALCVRVMDVAASQCFETGSDGLAMTLIASAILGNT
jgi:hypothetical protein